MAQHILSIITFLPLAGFFVILCIPESKAAAHRQVALLFSAVVFILSLYLIIGFHNIAAPQFTERILLSREFGISYFVGIDGLSLFLVLLVAFLTPIVVLSSFSSITAHTREYYALLLMLETGMTGALVSFDALLFYIFWELMLIPMFFIIGIWGGPQRIYATIKFVLFTLAGSLLMLIGIIYLAWQVGCQAGACSFSLFDFYTLQLSIKQQCFLFGAFALAFAIKVPLFPLHTWLPDAHVEAPTGGSVILAGILLKMGVYGFLRYALPVFPYAAHFFAPLIIALSVAGILYGALVAMVQEDVKKLVAYSSVSHLGYVMLGIFIFTVEGIQGGMYQMLSHGLSTGALFLIVGMLYERRHTRLIRDFGGIARVMPLMTVLFMITTLASISLPGLSGFIGEFLVLLAAFKSSIFACVLAAAGIIFGAVYMLWMLERVVFGPLTKDENRSLPDLNLREIAVVLPLVIMMFCMGLAPNPFLTRMESSAARLVQQVNRPAQPTLYLTHAEQGANIHERR